jgi:hypothetical protein
MKFKDKVVVITGGSSSPNFAWPHDSGIRLGA